MVYYDKEGYKLTVFSSNFYHCCAADCCENFLPSFVRLCHEKYSDKTGPQKEEFLAEKFRNSIRIPARGGFKYQFVVQQETVCLQGLLRIYGATRWHCRRAKRVAESGMANQHLSIGVRRKDPRSTLQFQMRAALDVYFQTYGDKHPSKDEIHMPCFVDKKDLYEYVMKEPTVKKIVGTKEFSLKSFQAILSTYFSNVKFPRFTRYPLHVG